MARGDEIVPTVLLMVWNITLTVDEGTRADTDDVVIGGGPERK